MIRRVFCAVALILAATQIAAHRAVAQEPPSMLLLGVGDLPPGYVRDDALENADATTRSEAYQDSLVEASFVGYRTARAAIVQYVALFHDGAEADDVLSSEQASIDAARTAVPLTVGSFGDAATIGYLLHRTHREEWTMLLFADGPYLALLGVYDATNVQAALDLVQQLAGITDRRLRVAVEITPPATAMPTVPALQTPPTGSTGPVARFVVRTTTRAGRASDVFRPNSTVYWQVAWRLAISAVTVETVTEAVTRGTTALYRNAMTDHGYAGDNILDDSLHLRNAAPGAYAVTVTIAINHVLSRAVHRFTVTSR